MHLKVFFNNNLLLIKKKKTFGNSIKDPAEVGALYTGYDLFLMLMVPPKITDSCI